MRIMLDIMTSIVNIFVVLNNKSENALFKWSCCRDNLLYFVN